MRRIDGRRVIGGRGCDCCNRKSSTIDLRPSGWLCEKHGPLAENQVVSFDCADHCLACLKEALADAKLTALKKRKLDFKEFSGYNLEDGRFIKSV